MVGARVATSPRGRQFIIATIAMPTISIRYWVGSNSSPKNAFQEIEFAQQLRAADDRDSGERDAELRSAPAKNHDGEDGRAFDEGEARWRDETLAHREKRAGKATEHRAKREGGEFEFDRVEAERAAGDLIFAQRLPGAPDRQPAHAHGHEMGEQREAEDQVIEKDHAMDRREFQPECRGETRSDRA